jgi:hypothetical protein
MDVITLKGAAIALHPRPPHPFPTMQSGAKLAPIRLIVLPSAEGSVVRRDRPGLGDVATPTLQTGEMADPCPTRPPALQSDPWRCPAGYPGLVVECGPQWWAGLRPLVHPEASARSQV